MKSRLYTQRGANLHVIAGILAAMTGRALADGSYTVASAALVLALLCVGVAQSNHSRMDH